jgi:hypothetical protein
MNKTHAPSPALRGLALLFLGAVLGPLGDFCHVISGTDAYPNSSLFIHPELIKMPFWVPPLFAGATLAVGFSHPFLDHFLGRTRQRLGARGIVPAALGALSFLALYAISGFLPGTAGSANDLFIGAGALAIWAIFDRTWQGLLLGAGTALAGTAVEITLVHQGAFYYLPRAANLFGVPSWLPWIYVAASVSVGNIGRIMAARRPHW